MTGGAHAGRAAQDDRNSSSSQNDGGSDNSDDYVETTHHADGSVTTKSILNYAGSAPDNRIQHKEED